MAAKINRYTLSRGPAEITLNLGNGKTLAHYLSAGDVVFDPGIATKDLESAAFGPTKTIRSGLRPLLSFTPLGMLRDLPATFSQAALTPGRSLVGSLDNSNPAVLVDNTVLIQPLDQTQPQTLLYGCGISKLPDLSLTSQAQVFSGDINFLVCGKNNVDADDAARIFTQAPNTLDHPHYDPATLFAQTYDVTTAVLNGGASIATVAGVKVVFGLAVTEKSADGLLYDVLFKSLKPVASFQPLGLAEADFLAALNIQGPNSVLGKATSDTGADLVISAPGAYVKLPLAGISKGSLVYGADAERIGELDLVAGVAVNAQGVPLPRFVLDTQPPA